MIRFQTDYEEGDLFSRGLRFGRVLRNPDKKPVEIYLSCIIPTWITGLVPDLYSGGAKKRHRKHFVLHAALRIGHLAKKYGRWPPRVKIGFFWSRSWDCFDD